MGDGLHELPRVQVVPFTVVAELARAALGIGLAATARDGLVVEAETVGTNHVGHEAEGAEKDATLPPPPPPPPEGDITLSTVQMEPPFGVWRENL
jgi:hypothetical protein